MTPRRRRILASSACLLALSSQGCGETRQERSEAEPAAAIAIETPGRSNRRVFEGCDPTEEARRYSSLVGERVSIIWAWQNMGEASAALRAPAVLLRVDPPLLAVAFESGVRNLELFTSVWLYSGHITALPDGSFAVAPCSATLEKDEP